MLQEKALAILKSGKNVFLTGSAGTGKTHVLNQYITYLKERKIAVAITASTGIAATHMNGMTIHSWAGIGVKDELTSSNLVGMRSKKHLSKHIGRVKVLIIDEISMLHKNQLGLVEVVVRYFKGNDLAFGGIQLVLCGDFFQLPPIGKPGETNKDKFSFMSGAWVKANLTVCYLTEQYRQDDNELNTILNQIRSGSVSRNSYSKLIETTQNKLSLEKERTKLYTHNHDVDLVNEKQLEMLIGKSKKFKAKKKGNKKLVEALSNTVLAGEKIVLKVGAKVMFVKNDPEKRYVNGSIGRVVDFSDTGMPKVKLTDGKIITTNEEVWKIQDDTGKVLANYKQLPLRLAWAITVHKCQGMTLDEAEIDLSKTFERGQGYVALSRLKRLENLNLIGLNEMALSVDPFVMKADKRFRELSEDADNNFSLKELTFLAKGFVKTCGGLIDKKEITQHKNWLKEQSRGKLSTYEVTLIHLKQQKSIKEIAKIRGLSVGTVTGHLIKIRKDHPSEDLSFYSPSKEVINKVKKAYEKQKTGSIISLGLIYKELGGDVTYDDIKLSIAFFS